MACMDRVLQGVAVQLNIDHVLAGCIHGFLDCHRNFPGLATTEAHSTFAVTNYSQSGERKNASTLNYFSDAVDLHELLLQLQTFLLVVTHVANPLKLESVFSGSISQSFNAAVILEAGAIEGNPGDTGALCSFSKQLAYFGCRFGVAGRTFSQLFIESGRSCQNLAAIGSGDLCVDMARRAVDAQAVNAQLTDLQACAGSTTQTGFFLNVHVSPLPTSS